MKVEASFHHGIPSEIVSPEEYPSKKAAIVAFKEFVREIRRFGEYPEAFAEIDGELYDSPRGGCRKIR